MKKVDIDSRFIAYTGITAAIYVALTWSLAPLSFMAIQLRLSEMLVLLVFIDKRYMPGILIGCAVANSISPLGLADVFFGTLSTFLASLAIMRTKNLFVATLWPTVFCFLIGLELYLVLNLPFLYSTLTVMLGEFIVLSGIGYVVFSNIIKNRGLYNFLKIKRQP